MKRLTLTICAAAFLFTACNNEKTADSTKNSDSTSASVDKVKEDPCAGYKPDSASMMPMDSAMMQAWGEFMTPGPEHAILAKSNGEWTGEMTQWMDPAAPPQKNTSKAINTMILGGRYQQSEHIGCFDGMPFEGISITGYDNKKKVYMSTWIDNMGTSIMMLEGPWDEASKSIKLKGKCTDPITGKTMDIREQFTIIDDNTQKMEMWGPDMKGKEFKMMEIVFKRKA